MDKHELEHQFYTGGEETDPVIKQYYIKLDGQIIEGASSRYTFDSIGSARSSFNQLFKYDSRDYGFKNPTELREYLEKENRLEYPSVELI